MTRIADINIEQNTCTLWLGENRQNLLVQLDLGNIKKSLASMNEMLKTLSLQPTSITPRKITDALVHYMDDDVVYEDEENIND